MQIEQILKPNSGKDSAAAGGWKQKFYFISSLGCVTYTILNPDYSQRCWSSDKHKDKWNKLQHVLYTIQKTWDQQQSQDHHSKALKWLVAFGPPQLRGTYNSWRSRGPLLLQLWRRHYSTHRCISLCASWWKLRYKCHSGPKKPWI
jgi:hypothetical protein